MNNQEINVPVVAPLLRIKGGDTDAAVQAHGALHFKQDGVLVWGVAADAAEWDLTGVDLAAGEMCVVGLYAEQIVATATNTYSIVATDPKAFAYTSAYKTGELPSEVPGKALIGWVVIVNATNPFVGGTTELDAAGVNCNFFDNFGFAGM